MTPIVYKMVVGAIDGALLVVVVYLFDRLILKRKRKK